MRENKLGFAVLGCGRMGRRRAKTVLSRSDATLKCVVDVNEEDARKIAKEVGCPYFTDYDKVLQRDDIDCYIVSLPNKFHAEVAVAILKNKKHVFCEKPLAKSPSEAEAMVLAAAENGVTLKVGSNLRYFPNVLKAKELLEQETIGNLTFLRAWIGNAGAHLKDSWYANSDLAGGGTFLDNGCHILDLTRWFFGEAKDCIGSISTNIWPVSPLEDNGFGIFNTLDNKVAFIQASWTEWAGYMYMEIYGSEGYICIDNRTVNCKTILGLKNGRRYEYDYSALPPESYTQEFSSYMEAVKKGEQAMPSGYDGMRAVKMAFGVYESARTGQKVMVYGEEDRRLKELAYRGKIDG